MDTTNLEWNVCWYAHYKMVSFIRFNIFLPLNPLPQKIQPSSSARETNTKQKNTKFPLYKKNLNNELNSEFLVSSEISYPLILTLNASKLD